MKKRYEYPLYAFYDHTGMARHLEKMSEKGWMLERIYTNSFWRYRRCEPKRRHFAVTYFPTASDFDAAPGADQQEFYDLCQAAGWQFVAQTFQMQVFCNEQEDPVPLETDPGIQVKNLHEGMWTSYMWGKIIVLGAAGAGLFSVLSLLTNHPIRALSRYLTLFCLMLCIFLALHQGAELAAYYLWHRKATRIAEEEGRFLATPTLLPGWNLILEAVCALLFIPFFFTNEWMLGLSLAVFSSAVLLCHRLSYLFRDFLKKKGVKNAVNRWSTLLVTFVLIFGVETVRGNNLEDILTGGHETVTYQYKGRTCTAYCDDLPLTMGDLTGTDDSLYSNRYYEIGTPLASISSGYQYRRSDAPKIVPQQFYYHLYRSGLGFTLEDAQRWNSYRVETVAGADELKDTQAVDPAPFGAQAAWYRTHSTSYQYLLRYEDCILQLYFDWEPTEAQLQTALDALLPL